MDRHGRRGVVLTLWLIAMMLLVVSGPALAEPPATAAPRNLAAADIGQIEVGFTWEIGTGDVVAQQFVITNLTSGAQQSFCGNCASGRFRGLEAGQTYHFKIHGTSFLGGDSQRVGPITVTTLGSIEAPAPSGLQATPYSNAVDLSWEPGSDDPALRYRVHNLTLGWTLDTPSTTLRWAIGPLSGGLRPGETHRFAVRHLDSDGHQSEPSNEVTVTLPEMDAPRAVQATREQDTIRVSWQRPEFAEPGRLRQYRILLDGNIERIVVGVADTVSVTLPVVNPGRVHAYTVQVGVGAISEPALLTIPPADDTVPPTAPRWLVHDATCEWEIVEDATDDVTPPERIRYEALARDPWTGQFHVVDYHMARTGSVNGSVLPEAVRAVDEAGNRSPIALPDPPGCWL